MNEELDNKKIDIAVSITKGIASLCPVIGGIVTEVIDNIIPNQRIDRIVDFLLILDTKLKDIEFEVFNLKMKTSEYVDLFEDSIVASTRALAEKRLYYIANLLVKSLDSDQIEIMNYKKILQLLNQLDDLDIILLRFYATKFYKNTVEEQDYKNIINSAFNSKALNVDILKYRLRFLNNLSLIIYANENFIPDDEVLYGRILKLGLTLLNVIGETNE